jgi:undecaprenyl-diphosphatase
MTIFHGLILGIIEGLTEFLPISSTAHLVLAGEWLRIPSSDFLKTFEISIQLDAILAIVVLYWKKIWSSWNLIGKLFHFNRDISSEDAIAEMDKDGFRPATLAELLALGEAQPELQKQFPIIALSSVCLATQKRNKKSLRTSSFVCLFYH